MSAIQLGPFQLQRPLGHGGMGEVWLARHVTHQSEVAVKVLTSAAARNQRYRRSFRREVQAMARLNHPHIALILDRGVISEQAAAASGGHFQASSPFLAMELIDGPTLDAKIGVLDWPELRQVLLQLLDALAHAHALDIIHRDLKPSNVLVDATSDELSVRLVDFGISAWFTDEQPDAWTEHTTGTPKYMAPEQVLAKRRDQGPWTDLYALGCLAWKMACGRAPFTGGSDDILRAHLDDDLPEFAPTVPVPDGFSQWLVGMLAKHPAQRFRRAADAAHALLALGQAPDEAHAPVVELMTAAPDEPTAMMHTLGPLTQTVRIDTEDLAREASQLRRGDAGAAPIIRPPLPPSWRGAEPLRRALSTVGASLGMYGLRIIPVVDRDQPRDVLWEQTAGAVNGPATRLTVLRGPAGSGKTRLARWLARRAHEVGAADILEATHSPMGSPADGLAAMVARYLRCVGQQPKEVFARIRSLYEQLGVTGRPGIIEPAALTELLDPHTSGEMDPAANYAFSNVGERYAVLSNFLDRLATQRALVIVLDDLQWGHEALGFVRHLLDEDLEAGIHLVATVRDDAVATNEALRAHLEALADDDRVATCALGPLSDAHQRELVERLLYLDAGLAGEVVARSAGNPMFAVQTVGDWVMQEMLELGPDGFRRRDEHVASLPDDLHHVWRQRLEHFLSQQPGEQRDALRDHLEIAAALGGDVTLKEWYAACARAGSRPAAGALDALIEHGLARRNDGGWAFASRFVVDVLERSARRRQRWAAHHRACADALVDLYPERTRGLQRRLGEHYISAGQTARAFEALYEAFEEARDFGELDQASEILRRRERLADEEGLDDEHVCRVQNWLLREKLDVRQSDFDTANAHVERALDVASRHGYDRERAVALVERGVLLSHAGEREASIDAYQQATAIFERLGLRDRLARALGELGVGFYANANYDEGIAALQWASDLFEQDDNLSLVAQCHVYLGNIHAAKKDFAAAKRCIDRAIELTEQSGNQRLLGECHFYAGEVARLEGDTATARRRFLQSVAVYQPIDEHSTNLARMGVAITEVQLEQYARAEALFERLLRHFSRRGQTHYACFTLLGLLCCAAYRHDWPTWDDHARQLETQLATARLVDHAFLTLSETAARLARDAGQDERAGFAEALAAQQREALGD